MSATNVQIVSKRLLIVTVVTLGLTVALFLLPLIGIGRFPISWFCFEAGIIGGFVSIQQRLKLLSGDELAHLAESWVGVLLIPIFGGIFALVFYMLTLSGILEGALFPSFSIPAFADSPTPEDLRRFLTETYPASGEDFARLGFWAFACGFSERLVPDMIKGTIGRSKVAAEAAQEPEAPE